jgi:hypothetical protein
MKKLLILLPLCFIISCGGGSGSEDDLVNAGEVLSEVIEDNPIVKTQFFGDGGNLYKPKADAHGAGAGNLVILADASFTRQFESCSIKLNTGEISQLYCINDQPWTQIPYSCFSNGNRQTWRANAKCEDVAEVKVTCKDLNQEIVFTVPEEVRNRICWRHG